MEKNGLARMWDHLYGTMFSTKYVRNHSVACDLNQKFDNILVYIRPYTRTFFTYLSFSSSGGASKRKASRRR